MKKNIIFLIIVIIVFLASLAFFIYAMQYSNNNNNNETESNVEVQEDIYQESQTKDLEAKYTDITFYKEDNTEVKLSDFKDKPVMILFFNNEEASMNVLQKVENVYKDFKEKIQFIMINTSQEVDTSLKENYSMEIYYDFYKEAVRNYNITEMPAMIYISKENQVVNAKTGETTADALDANLNILIENY